MLNRAIDISNFQEHSEPKKIIIDSPGVYDINIDDYHSSNGISRSGIMKFNKTPFHFYSEYVLGNKEKKTSSRFLSIGSALHTFVLEPHLFEQCYQVIEKKDRRTKEGKQYYELIETSSLGKELITEDDFAIIKTMGESLMLNDKINKLISGAQYEKSLYWTDPHTGILCKCRPDIWQPGFIGDLKTSADASYREFQRSLYNYGYHIQCAMIHEAFKNLFNEIITDFIFIVIENTAPYAHAIYKLDELSLQQSVEIFKNKLLELKQCYDKNTWPSYNTQIISLPNYATFGE